MSAGICNMQKVTNAHDIAGMQIHELRERERNNSNPDIDRKRTHLNYSMHEQTEETEGKSYNQIIDYIIKQNYTSTRKIRKDAVRMVKLLFTSDSDFFADKTAEDTKEYFRDCYNWACNRYGTDNIISAEVHMDEKTPHMHLNFVPLVNTVNKKTGEVTKTLNVHKAVGSGSKALQHLQDDFYEDVCKKWGLDRGTRSDLSNAGAPRPRKHQRVSEYKSTTNYYQQQAEQALNKIKQEVEALGSQKETLTSDYNALQATYKALQAALNDLNDKKHQLDEECDRERSRLSEREQAVEEREQNIENELSELKEELTLKEKEKQYYAGLWYSAIDIAKADWNIEITEEECKAVASACCSDNSDPEHPIYDYQNATDEDIVEALKNMNKDIDTLSR